MKINCMCKIFPPKKNQARGTGTSAPVAVQENVVVLAAPTERRASAEAATALAVGNEGVQGGGGGTSSSSALHPFVAAKKGKFAGGDMVRDGWGDGGG